MKKLLLLTPLLLLIQACTREPTATPDKPALPGQYLLVLNEGNFQWGNASLSLWHLDSSYLISEDIFSARNSRPLGDVVQNGLFVKNPDELALVINNSARVDFLDEQTLVVNSSVQGLGAPRYLTQHATDPDLFVVTELYDDSLRMISRSRRQVVKTLYLKGWTEGILTLPQGDYLVTNKQTNSLYRVDANLNRVKDSLLLSFGTFMIQKAPDGKIWVAAMGDKDKGIEGALHVLEEDGSSVLNSYPAQGRQITELYVSESNEIAVIANGDIFRFTGGQSPDWSTPWLASRGTNYMRIRHFRSHWFVSDAFDFVQRGEVLILDDNGQQKASFRAGKIPTELLLLPY